MAAEQQPPVTDSIARPFQRIVRRPVSAAGRGLAAVRNLPWRRARLLVYLSVLGPGLIAAAAGNDAGGIATYSVIGAEFGYRLLWTSIPMALSLVAIQEICARLGAVTGKGFGDLVREQYGVRWTVFLMGSLLVANAATTVSEFVAVGASLELFGASAYLTVPFAALLLWAFIVSGSYRHIERVFIGMSLVFLGYVISAWLAEPNWHEVGRQLVRPSFSFDARYLLAFVAMVGTTITPYMQLYVQSSVVEKGITAEDYHLARADVIIGVVFSTLVTFFILVCTAATLHRAGIHVDTAAHAARALEPLAGRYAGGLFAVGLFGASMLAAGVVPLATAYSLSEAFGFERGVSNNFREAPVFLGIFTALVALGCVVGMIPNLPVIRLLLVIQIIDAVVLPVELFALLRLVNDRDLMGERVNSLAANLVTWTTAVGVSGLSLVLLASGFLELVRR